MSKFFRSPVIAAVANLTLLTALGVSGPAAASDIRAKVVDVAPLYETLEYRVPREQCRVERVARHSRSTHSYRDQGHSRSQRHSATPGIVGAILGGALGNAVGHNKTNKRIGTAVGAILGGSIGADIARRKHSTPLRYRSQEVCTWVDDYRTEERVTGYDVTYIYGGETYSTIMSSDPGAYLDVNVRVTPVVR